MLALASFDSDSDESFDGFDDRFESRVAKRFADILANFGDKKVASNDCPSEAFYTAVCPKLQHLKCSTCCHSDCKQFTGSCCKRKY